MIFSEERFVPGGSFPVRYRARTIGPAAAAALASAGAGLRVHSVFPSTVNLEVTGTGNCVTLCASAAAAGPMVRAR